MTKKYQTEEFKVKPPVDAKNPDHYVNNAEFKIALQEHAAKCAAARENGLPLPQISNYIGDCFLKIANGLASKYNFRNYSYIRDMVSDAVFICVKNIECFDVNKGTSAFAYFTQCVYWSFLGSIKKEKKEELKKREMFFKGEYDSFSTSEEDSEFQMSYTEFIKGMGTNTETYISPEQKKAQNKMKRASAFDLFFED